MPGDPIRAADMKPCRIYDYADHKCTRVYGLRTTILCGSTAWARSPGRERAVVDRLHGIGLSRRGYKIATRFTRFHHQQDVFVPLSAPTLPVISIILFHSPDPSHHHPSHIPISCPVHPPSQPVQPSDPPFLIEQSRSMPSLLSRMLRPVRMPSIQRMARSATRQQGM